ncbi:MAG: TIGR04211 family SH3 domain-containing protein [Desulfobacteraceae bacterium]|nr:TIGR04211 family SH3 domain-containing protein [Desulfobacteraceae bacterium]
MKAFTAWCLLITGLVLPISDTALAETMYVTEEFEITMRTGPGVERKIIALIKSGQSLEVLSLGDEWAEVQLTSGKQGWVLSRYLTSKTPSSYVLKNLGTEHSSLKEQRDALVADTANLNDEKNRFKAELQQTRQQLDKITKEFETLKKESKEFIALKNKFDATTKNLTEERTRADSFEDQTRQLLRTQNIKWFLSGAGVLLLGFIIGFSTRRQKRRSSLL